ncbi:MAG: hypothetical protein AAB474_03030 [Patescibacteria group bacterium]
MDIVAPKKKITQKPEPAAGNEPETERKKEMPALISWSAPEYDYRTKSKEWYWAIGILSAALVIMAVLMKNFLFAIFIVLAGFTTALYGAKRPAIAKFTVSGSGIQIADRFYPYESLKSFWINYDPPQKKEISVISKKMFMPRLTLPIGETDPNELQKILARTLKEEKIEESLSEIIAGYLGF